MSWCRGEELHHTSATGTYNAGQSDSLNVSSPLMGESSCDRNSFCHGLKARISYAYICCGYYHPLCGRGKGKGLTQKRKLRPVSPMTVGITGDRYQTCQKDEINHHSFDF